MNTSTQGYFASRWHGGVPLSHLFWQDMVIFGTGVNVAAALAMMLMLAAGLPAVLAVFVFLSPLPYNLFLVGAVWRAAGTASDLWGGAVRAASLVWFVVATLI